MATLFWLCLFAWISSDQWWSIFLCQGQEQVWFMQNERIKLLQWAAQGLGKRQQLDCLAPRQSPALRVLMVNTFWDILASTVTSLSDFHILATCSASASCGLSFPSTFLPVLQPLLTPPQHWLVTGAMLWRVGEGHCTFFSSITFSRSQPTGA